MHSLLLLLLLLLPFLHSSLALNLVLSNDDGWAEANIRVFYNSLKAAGYNVVLSAPAENKSGTGSSDAAPTPRTTACEFGSCAAGSGSVGFNGSDTRLNWVNSFPVTSMRFGIQTLSPMFFGGLPDIAVAGPNVGGNRGTTTQISGTVGAAAEAALEGIPAIAFSGSSGSQVSYTTALQTYQSNYALLSTIITTTLVNGGPKPFLPPGIFLNVNFPSSSSTTCSTPGAFKFVLTRINTASSGAAADVKTCGGQTRLPTENTANTGCTVSISVGNATTKNDVDAGTQGVVLNRLSSILSCL